MKLTRLLKLLSNPRNISSSIVPFSSSSSQSSRQPSPSSSSSSSSTTSFISTPIFYVNGSPHLGHAHSAVLADALHRWRLLKSVASSDNNNNTPSSIFSTGTDEHGVKVAQAAQRFAMSPIQLCDAKSAEFRGLFDLLDVKYTDFVRTTEERHRLAVDAFWRRLNEKGYIYKGSYAGWYSIVEEAYLPPSAIVKESKECPGKFICSETENVVEWNEEENYLFRLTDFKEELKKWLTQNEVIQPSWFLQWVLASLDGLQTDLSVSRSRSRLAWGHPVPDDDTQTVYVWLDALVNYLTVAGFPDSRRHADSWGNATHVIGKDIIKFHAIYWPAFLMAAELPLPKKIVVHSHWLVDHRKMSKSLNNVVDPKEIVDRVSVDGLRYFLLAEATPEQDSNFSEKKLVEKLNAELCNTLGNLLNRVVGKNLNPHQHFPIPSTSAFRQFENPHLDSLVDSLNSLPSRVDEAFEALRIDRGIDSIMAALREANQLLQSARPWKLDANAQADQIKVVLYLAMETIRVCGILLLPIVPSLAGKMLDVINVSDDRRNWVELRNSQRPLHHVTTLAGELRNSQQRPLLHHVTTLGGENSREVLFMTSLADIPLNIKHQLPLYPRLRP